MTRKPVRSRPSSEGGDKDEKELGKKTFQVEMVLELVEHAKKQYPGEGVQAERVSREEIQEVSQGKDQNPSEKRGKGEDDPQREDKHQIRSDPMDRKDKQDRRLSGQEYNSR